MNIFFLLEYRFQPSIMIFNLDVFKCDMWHKQKLPHGTLIEIWKIQFKQVFIYISR